MKKAFLIVSIVLFSVMLSASVFAPSLCEYGLCGAWLPVDSGTTADLYAVDFDYGGFNGLAVGAGGTILYSDDEGVTWTSQVTPSNPDLYGVLNSPPYDVIAVGAGGTIMKYYNQSWTVKTSGTSEDLFDVVVGGAMASTLIAVGAGETILKSTDYGATWVDKTSGISGHDPAIDLVDVQRPNTNMLVAVGRGGHAGGAILYSYDEGETWTAESHPSLSGVSFSDDQTGLVVSNCASAVGCGDFSVQKTTDGGENWETVLPWAPDSYALNAVSTHTYFDNLVWAAGSSDIGAILYSYDGGETWTNQMEKLNLSQVMTDLEVTRRISEGLEVGWAVGTGGTILKYVGQDTDNDRIPDIVDNCDYIPNVEQQDLDEDGIGTWCDETEFDINVRQMGPRDDSGRLVGMGTKHYGWGVIDNQNCTTGWLCAITHGIAGIYLGPFSFPLGPDPTSAVGLRPYSFGDGTWTKFSKLIDTGAGVQWEGLVALSSVPGCEGGFVGGPFSMAGVGYSFGFNKECTEHLISQPELEVAYEISLQKHWDVYTNWDTTPVDVTGTNFTVTNDMGLVFVEPISGHAVRFSLPLLATAGEDVEMTPEQKEQFNETCKMLLTDSSNDDPGLISACEQVAANSLPRGADVFVGTGHLEVTYTGGSSPYDIKAVIPGSLLSQVSAETNEMSVSNAMTLAEYDGINMYHTGDFSPRFTWDTDMTVGSIIPVVGTSMEILDGTINMVVDQPIDLKDPETVKDALGLAVVGGILRIENAHFQSATENPYMGHAFAMADVEILNSIFDDSVSGFAAVNANVFADGITLNTMTLSEITPEFRDIRSKYAHVCSEESIWGLQNEGGVIEDWTLPSGRALFDAALGGLYGSLSDYIPCALNMTNAELNAGEFNGIVIASAREAARRSKCLNHFQLEDVPAQSPAVVTPQFSLTNVNVNARQAITVAGLSQDPLEAPLEVEINNFNAVSQVCGFVGGSLDLTVNGGSCVGTTDRSGSFGGWGVAMSGQGFADLNLNVLHDMDELDNAWIRNFEINGMTITNHGTHPTASMYDWADKAMTFYNEEPGEPYYNDAGVVRVENVVATLEGAAQPIAVYGEMPQMTVVDGPVIEYPECTGNSAINAKVTSNDVQANGAPGQQPLEGATVKVFDKVCADAYPDPTDVLANCQVESSCTTDADGLCTAECLEAGQYFALVEHLNYAGKYPSHAIGNIADGQTKYARFAFLKAPDGQVSPGKTKVQTGSELWIYEPSYVVWEGTEQYYPFVFESPDNQWTVDVCIDAPEGYEPVDGVECLQTIIAGESKSILFQLVEVGSVPGPTGIEFDMESPSGKKYHVASQVGMRLSENLAKAKGVAIDKNGRLLGKGKGKGVGLTGAAVMGEASGKTAFGVLLVIVLVALAGALVYLKRKQE